MNLKNGFSRIAILLTAIWLGTITLWAYYDYPPASKFGGIPVGEFTFWEIEENVFNQFDPPNSPPGPYEVSPRYLVFWSYITFPIFVLWSGVWGVLWVAAGFGKNV